ncbi:MAG: class I SAM-dependent methyltransferase [Polyangiaceae bacterium]
MAAPPSRISPTAHYTGYVWSRNGLSPPRFATTRGAAMFHALEGPMRLAAATTGGLTLERMLLQRHLVIDHLLDRAIASGRVGQVVEIAAGMSGRGLRFSERYPFLRYVEGDLPGMVARKRIAVGTAPPGLSLVAIDALVDDGPHALVTRIAPRLDERKGVAVITEGLLSYYSQADAEGMWRRFLRLTAHCPSALYLSDVHFDHLQAAASRAFRRGLGWFARGNVHLFEGDEAAFEARARAVGFDRATLHAPLDFGDVLELPLGGIDVVRILAAERGLTGARDASP